MTTTVEAIYENGKLVLPRPLSLPENTHVRVTIESNGADDTFDELSAMAGDPQIQRELRAISAEFASAESDGLGKI
jgi:predicted DNA-binding antitoxin AbrB/MazE fold protein